MRELDARFEDELRAALRAEADSLPLLLDVARLEQGLLRRRQQAARRLRLLGAAAAVALLAGAGTLLIASGWRMPNVAVTPAPSMVPPSIGELPAGATLLEGAGAQLRLEGSAGPATDPISDDATIVRIVVGRVVLDGPFVAAAACLGPGSATLEVVEVGAAAPFLTVPVPCEAVGVQNTHRVAPPDRGEGHEVRIVLARGASWRVALGVLVAGIPPRPSFGAIAGPPGGSRQYEDAHHVTAGQPVGVAARVPQEGGRLIVTAQCVGEASLTLQAGDRTVVVDCRVPDALGRLEPEGEPGSQVTVRATADAPAWVRLVVASDGPLGRRYGAPPTMPAIVARAPYAEWCCQFLALGTLGGEQQVLVPLKDAMVGSPGGELVPVAVFDPTTLEYRLQLFAATDGAVVASIGTWDGRVARPGYSWVDERRGRVVYQLDRPDRIEFRSVAVDGTDDRVLLTIDDPGNEADPLGLLSAALAARGEALAVQTCRPSGCRLLVADLEARSTGEIDTTATPACEILGVADGYVVARSQPGCGAPDTTDVPGAISVVAIPLAGGPARTVAGDAHGRLVSTTAGPRFVFTDLGSTGPQRILVVDLEGGSPDVIHELPAGHPATLGVSGVRVPQDWVLLAGPLSDAPMLGWLTRDPPLLVNLVTGQSIELVNLPHGKGSPFPSAPAGPPPAGSQP